MAESLGRGVEATLGLAAARGDGAVCGADHSVERAPGGSRMLAAAGAIAVARRARVDRTGSLRGCARSRSSEPISGSTTARSGTTATRPTSSLPATPSRRACVRWRDRFASGTSNVGDLAAVYPGAALMADDISAALRSSRQRAARVRCRERAPGGEPVVRARGRSADSRSLRGQLSVVPASRRPTRFRGFAHAVERGDIVRRARRRCSSASSPFRYARFISAAAVPGVERRRSSATVVDPQFAIDRVVLLDSAPAIAPGAIPNPLPPASNRGRHIRRLEAGRDATCG